MLQHRCLDYCVEHSISALFTDDGFAHFDTHRHIGLIYIIVISNLEIRIPLQIRVHRFDSGTRLHLKSIGYEIFTPRDPRRLNIRLNILFLFCSLLKPNRIHATSLGCAITKKDCG